MNLKLLSLIFLLLLKKDAFCAIWKPFPTRFKVLTQTEATAEGSFNADYLCLLWMSRRKNKNVVCHEEKTKVCRGYKAKLPMTVTNKKTDGWKCYSKWGTVSNF